MARERPSPERAGCRGWAPAAGRWQNEEPGHWVKGLSGHRKVDRDSAGAAASTPRVLLWLCWVFRGYGHTCAPWFPRPAEPNRESRLLVPPPTHRSAPALKGSQRLSFPQGPPLLVGGEWESHSTGQCPLGWHTGSSRTYTCPSLRFLVTSEHQETSTRGTQKTSRDSCLSPSARSRYVDRLCCPGGHAQQPGLAGSSPTCSLLTGSWREAQGRRGRSFRAEHSGGIQHAWCLLVSSDLAPVWIP